MFKIAIIALNERNSPFLFQKYGMTSQEEPPNTYAILGLNFASLRFAIIWNLNKRLFAAGSNRGAEGEFILQTSPKNLYK